MKRKSITPDEFAKRFAIIEEVEPDSIDKAMLQANAHLHSPELFRN